MKSKYLIYRTKYKVAQMTIFQLHFRAPVSLLTKVNIIMGKSGHVRAYICKGTSYADYYSQTRDKHLSDYKNIKYIASFLNHLKRLHLWRAICIVHRLGREWRQTFIRDFFRP